MPTIDQDTKLTASVSFEQAPDAGGGTSNLPATGGSDSIPMLGAVRTLLFATTIGRLFLARSVTGQPR